PHREPPGKPDEIKTERKTERPNTPSQEPRHKRSEPRHKRSEPRHRHNGPRHKRSGPKTLRCRGHPFPTWKGDDIVAEPDRQKPIEYIDKATSHPQKPYCPYSPM